MLPSNRPFFSGSRACRIAIFMTLFSTSALSWTAASADDGHGYGSLGLARTDLALDVSSRPDFLAGDGRQDTVGQALTLGYQFDRPYFELRMSTSNGLVSSFLSAFGLETLDYYKLQFTAGYDLPIGSNSRFSIGPELAAARIEVTAREGALFNPGAEAQKELNENGWGAGIQAKLRLSQTFKLKLSYGWYEMDPVEQVDGMLSLEAHFR